MLNLIIKITWMAISERGNKMYNVNETYQYTKNLNILYVEDDIELLKSTARLLENFFLSVTIAYNGLNGIETYIEYKKQTNQYFDLVITDINMPILDGIGMIKQIKDINQNQSVIVISAYNDSDRLIDLIQLGIANFVMKPIDLDQLLCMLSQTCKNIFNEKDKEKLLLTQSRLASMGKMIDSIAHQWLQPLNIVKMQSEMLEMDSIDGNITQDTISKYLYSQSNQIDHLIETLNEFRGFFRPNYNLEITTYKNLVDSVLLLLKDSLVLNTVKVEVNLDKKNTINVISNEFKHILINIINNSIDAFKDNDIKYDKRKITFNSYVENESTVLTICDTAGGISEDVINKIFTSNFTTKQTGTGVGLYMSYQIIEKIKGTISVSNVDNGACFKIILKSNSKTSIKST